MRVVRRGVLAFVFASILLIGAVGPAMASGDPVPRDDHVDVTQLRFQDDGESAINVTQEFRLTPSTPGEVTVQLRFSIPTRVVSLRTAVPDDAEVTRTQGFDRATSREYDWDQTTNQPSLTYTLPVNESLNDTSPEGAGGDLVAVDAGEWALFQRPPTPTHWEAYALEGPVEFHHTATTAGHGATGEWLVFLGEHETYERTAHDQRFQLVVPSNANMTDSPETVLDSLADASNALRVGDRDEEVFVIAAPTDGVQWGVRGLQTGEADLWVRDVEPVASPENAWVHEYVHSRQEFTLGPEMRWFREASASYYAALLTYEQSHIRYEGFSNRIATGSNSSYADAVLANQSTWQANPDYVKGALVAGQLDRQIRNVRDQERTLQTVFRAMNGDPDRTTLSDFLAYLGEHGDESVVDTGSRYAETTDNVTMWNQTAHVMAFGDLPARIGFQFPSDANNGTYRVNGSYRNATVSGGADPIVVVPGEQLRVGAVVDNSGGRTGDYTASLAVNGTVVDRAKGSVAPNETVTAELNHTFATPGTYDLTLDGDNRTVEVREPADGHVTNVTATSRDVWKGESLEVSARVENNASIPAETTVVFRRDDGLLIRETVHVGPGATEWANVTVPMSRAGTTIITVDGAGSVEVAVRAPPVRTTVNEITTTATPYRSTTQTTATPTAQPATTDSTEQAVSGGSGPGFGGITVTLTVALTAVLALLRERR